jgi:O-methyltransferase involved in polyketide biosynthesis
MSETDRISPTAHYTGHVWARNGLSHPELDTLEGRVLFETVRPANIVSGALGGPTLERYLLARHRAIDAMLERAIEERAVTQVVEVACGMSPRGWRFAQRFGSRITYVEADLPGMAARKRRALEKIGSLGDAHRVVEIDALEDSGELSLRSLADSLDRGEGLAIVTEGLLGYLDRDSMLGVWRRFASVLREFASGSYISDLHLGDMQTPEIRAFRVVLGVFVRGRVHLHFNSPAEAIAALHDAGFPHATVRAAEKLVGAPDDAGSRLAHILEASTVSK